MDVFEKVVDDVERVGWHCMWVGGAPGHPSYGYSIGLHRTFGHPEILIFGLEPRNTHGIMSTIVGDIRAGRGRHAGERAPDLLVGLECVFLKVPRQRLREFVGIAIRFHGNDAFPCLQLVWPDEGGYFPWDPGMRARLRALQPVLGPVVVDGPRPGEGAEPSAPADEGDDDGLDTPRPA
jgi:hypothetical protein